jgi:hypothetical protein
VNAVGRLKLPQDEREKTRLVMAVDNVRRSAEWAIIAQSLIQPNLDAELEVLESQTDDKLIFRAQGRRTALGDLMKLFDAVDKAVREGKRTI